MKYPFNFVTLTLITQVRIFWRQNLTGLHIEGIRYRREYVHDITQTYIYIIILFFSDIVTAVEIRNTP